jgi:hypothetical protein
MVESPPLVLMKLVFFSDNGVQNFAHSRNHLHDKRVTHAEVAHAIRHAGVGPFVVKTLETFSLNGGQ